MVDAVAVQLALDDGIADGGDVGVASAVKLLTALRVRVALAVALDENDPVEVGLVDATAVADAEAVAGQEATG